MEEDNKSNLYKVYDISKGEFRVREEEDKVFIRDKKTGAIELSLNPYKTKFSSELHLVDPQIMKEFNELGFLPSSNQLKDYETADDILASNTSLWQDFGKFSKGLFENFKAGTLMAASSYKLGDGINMLSGAEKEYKNSFFESALDTLKKSGIENRIRVYGDEREFDPGNSAWWLNNMQTLGISVGIMAPSLIESAILGMLTSAVGGAGAAAPLIESTRTLRALSKAKKTLYALQKLGSHKVVNQALFGAFKGFQEGIIEGYDSYNSTKESLMAKGIEEKDANKFASIAAGHTFRNGVLPLMALNSLQFGLLSKGISGIKNNFFRGATEFGIQSTSEALEETIQEVAQQEGAYQGTKTAGLFTKEDQNFLGRQADFLSNERTWTAAIIGAMGGGIFHGIGSATTHLSNKYDPNSNYNKHRKFIDGLQNKNLKYVREIIDLEAKGDIEGALRKRVQMSANMGLGALMLDDVMEKTTAQEGHEKFLENTLNYTLTNNEERLKELGIEKEDHDYIKNNFPKLIEDFKEIKSLYEHEKSKRTSRFTIADVVANKFNINAINKDLNEVDNRINKELDSIEYKNISSHGRRRVKLEAEVALLEEKAKAKGGVTAEEKKRMQDIQEELDSIERYTPQDVMILKDMQHLEIFKLFAKKYYAPRVLEKIYKRLENLNNADSVIKHYFNKRLKELEVIKDDSVKLEAEKFDIENDDRFTVAQKEAAKKIIDSYIKINNSKTVVNNTALNIEDAAKKTVITVPEADKIIINDELNEEEINASEELKNIINENNEEEFIKDSFENPLKVEGNTKKEVIENLTTEKKERGRPKKQKVVEKQIEPIIENTKEEVPVYEESFFDDILDPSEDQIEKIFNKTVEFLSKFRNIENPTLEDISKLALEMGANASMIERLKEYYNNNDELIAQNELKKEYSELNALFNSEQSEQKEGKKNEEKELTDEEFFDKIHDKKIHTSDITLAFLSEKYIINEEGKIEDLGELEDSPTIDSYYTLDPANMAPGTRLVAEIPEGDLHFDNILVHKWADVESGKRGEIILFKHLKLERGSEAWIEKVPIVVYVVDEHGNRLNPRPVAFISDVDRFNNSTVSDFGGDFARRDRIIAEAKENHRNLRKEIVKNNGKLDLVVTEKKKGSFSNIDIEKEDKLIPLNETGGILTYAIGEAQLQEIEGTNVKIINAKEKYSVGELIELRETANEGYYYPFRIKMPILEEEQEIIDAIIGAIKYKFAKGDKEFKKIGDFAVSLSGEFSNYLNMFMLIRKFPKNFSYKTEDGKNSQKVITEWLINTFGNRTKNVGLPLVYFHSGTIYYTRIGTGIVNYFSQSTYNENITAMDENGNMDTMTKLEAFEIFLKSGLPKIVEDKDGNKKKIITNQMRINVSDYQMYFKNNREITILDKEGKEKKVRYRDFMKSHLKSNVKVYNIGTKENPKYITFVQPGIKVERLGSKEKAVETEEKRNREIEEKKLKEVKPVIELSEQDKKDLLQVLKTMRHNPEEYATSIEELEKLLNINQEDLPSDVSLSTKTTESIRDKLIERSSIINSITQNQELSLINNFLNVFLKNKDIEKSKKVIIKKITEYMDNQLSIKENLSRLIETTGIKDLVISIEKDIDKAKAVLENLDKLLEKAQEKIKKYEKLAEIENMTIEEEADEINTIEKNFNSKSYERGNKKKVSLVYKKFISGLNKRRNNKIVDGVLVEGEVIRGLFDMEDYESFDTVHDRLISIISGNFETEANLNSIVNKLKENYEIPWIPELIRKIKTAKKNEKAALVSELHKHNLAMVFGLFSEDRNGNFNLRQTFSNSSDIENTIVKLWTSNIFTNNLINYNNETNNWEVNNIYLKNKLIEIAKRLKLNTDKDIIELLEDIKNSFVDKTRWKDIRELLDNYNKDKTKTVYFQSYKTKLNLLKTAFTTNIVNLNAKKSDIFRDFLKIFGIDISTQVIEDLISKGIYLNNKNGKLDTLLFSEMFTNDKGVFKHIFDFIEKNIKDNKEATSLEENNSNDPLNCKSLLKKLALIESKYNLYTSPVSFRDGDKTIDAKPLPKFATEQVARLKNDNPEYRDSFLDSNRPFSMNSLLLRALENEVFRKEIFAVYHTPNNTIKEQGKKFFKDSSITDLSYIDFEYFTQIMFQDNNNKKLSNFSFMDFYDFRIGSILFSTMSDKDQMLMLKTILLDIKQEHFQNTENIEDLNDKILEILYNQIVEPELNRIIKSLDSVTNIEGYEDGKYTFFMLPTMNNIKINGNKIGEILNTPGVNKEDLKKILENENNIESFKSEAKKEIQRIVKGLVDDRVANWEKYFTTNKVEEDFKKAFDKNYIFEKGSKNANKLRITAYDVVVNYLIQRANQHMLFSGDIALYNNISQENIFKAIIDDKIEKTLNERTYSNLSKRLALLIAPSKRLFNSALNNEIDAVENMDYLNPTKYLQIFVEDINIHSSSLKYLAKLHDGKELSEEDYNLIIDYANGKLTKNDIKNLFIKYPKTSHFFKINKTDGQEFTTALEHLETLQRSGKLEDEVWDDIRETLQKQYEWEAKNPNKQLPKELYLNPKQINLLTNPVKPVYAGLIKENNFMRMVYVKSSSFPLLPQMTQGSHLDKLRKDMEKIQYEGKQNVRLAFASAVKTGNNKVRAKIFDDQGVYIGNEKLLKDSSIILNREDFGIQQETPVHTKENEIDRVSLATQALKILFSNGVLDINDFQYKSRAFSDEGILNLLGENGIDLAKGENLHKLFDQTWITFIESNKKMLLDEFYLNNDFTSKDSVKTIKKIQKILTKEAINRGYPKSDIDGLKLFAYATVKITLNNGQEKLKIHKISSENLEKITENNDFTAFKKVYPDVKKVEIQKINKIKFVTPLWLHTNTYRFEALLNSIINKRLINLKLPGSSFIIGSEVGLDIDPSNTTRSRIIYTSAYDFELGKLRHTYVDDDGKFHGSQVFIPSRLRDNDGKLIEFIFEDGSFNEKYVYKDENGYLRLREDKISKELLNFTSFRIPTSGHVSLSQLEIAGFLPPEMGELMIINESLIAQKGIDFDIDKEYSYMVHHYIDENGVVKILDREYIDNIYKDIEEIKLTKIDVKSDKLEFLIKFEEYVKKLKENNYEDNDELDDLKDELVVFRDRVKENEDFDFDAEVRQLKKKITKKLYNKLYENEIIGIHGAVLSNPNPEMQRKITKSLNTQYSESQADLISNSLNTSKDYSLLTPLDLEYQRDIMEKGSVGKMAIGVYSNYLTQLGQIQQYGADYFKDFILGNLTTDGFKSSSILKPKNIPEELWDQIKTSRGEIFEEKQNTATDNFKVNVLGRVGVNSQTINVESLFSSLGLEKDYFEIKKEEYNESSNTDYQINDKFYRVVSIPYLFISQPIIKAYLSIFNEKQSIITEYESEIEENTLRELFKNLTSKEIDEKEFEEISKNITGKYLFENLNSKIDSPEQKVILQIFLEKQREAREFSTFQSYSNITKNGLDKSFLNVTDKRFFLTRVQNSDSFNFSNLIGDFEYDTKENPLSNAEKVFLKNSGYIFVGNGVYVKPQTPIGSMYVHGIDSGYNLWKDFFINDSSLIYKMIGELNSILIGDKTSPTKRVEKEQKIMKEFRKFILSGQVQFFSEETDLYELKKRLLVDNPKTGKKSLGTYLKENLSNPKLRDNTFLNIFEFDFNIKGTEIHFNNSKEDDFDDEYLYNGLLDLIINNKELPSFEGKPYSTEKLAMDLISYAFLTGGVQEAVQFVKVIPTSILEAYGVSLNLSAIEEVIKEPFLNSKEPNIEKILYNIGNFFEQYIRNNPQEVAQVLLSDIEVLEYTESGSKALSNIYSFKVSSKKSVKERISTNGEAFLSIYDPFLPRGSNKRMLFKKSGDIYYRISTLGYRYIDEYDFHVTLPKSIFDRVYTSSKNEIANEFFNKPDTKEINLLSFTEENKDINKIVDKILETKFNFDNYVKETFKFLKDNNFIKDVNFSIVEDSENYNGRYNQNTNTIILNKSKIKYLSNEEIAKVILKEYVHSITTKEISIFLDSQGNFKEGYSIDNIPAAISNIRRIFLEYKKRYTEEELSEYKRKFKNHGASKLEKITVYPATSIFEFMEVFFTEPEFQKELSKKDSSEKLSVFEKLINEITKLFKELFKNVKENKLSGEVLMNIIKIMEIETTNVNEDINTKVENYFNDNVIKKEKEQDRVIAIIGTAGRSQVPTLQEWNNMLTDARQRVNSNDILISGGAAFADHVAVKLFLEGKVKGLKLRLPAKIKDGKFVGGYGTAGGTANYYHARFDKVTGENSIVEIQEAIDKGAEVTYETEVSNKAMFIRNDKVAEESNSMIAYTYGEGNEPADGGTKDTWNKAKYTDKTHVSISKIEVSKQNTPKFIRPEDIDFDVLPSDISISEIDNIALKYNITATGFFNKNVNYTGLKREVENLGYKLEETSNNNGYKITKNGKFYKPSQEVLSGKVKNSKLSNLINNGEITFRDEDGNLCK